MNIDFTFDALQKEISMLRKNFDRLGDIPKAVSLFSNIRMRIDSLEQELSFRMKETAKQMIEYYGEAEAKSRMTRLPYLKRNKRRSRRRTSRR